MHALQKSLLTIVALLACPAPAAAAADRQACDAVRRMAAAARERPPFTSMERALANGEAVVPGFQAANCEAAADHLSCSVRDMGSHFSAWRDITGCSGLAISEVSNERGPLSWRRVYVMPGLRFEFGVQCPVCAGGAVSHFIAVPVHRRPEN